MPQEVKDSSQQQVNQDKKDIHQTETLLHYNYQQNNLKNTLLLLVVINCIILIIFYLLKRGTPFLQNPLISHQNYGLSLIYFKLYGKDIPFQYLQFQRKYYEEKYQIHNYNKQIPICVFIPSYNNQVNDRYLMNLNSVFRQNYSNYHVIYFNDRSTDKTVQLVTKYQQQNKIAKQKMKIINSKQNLKPVRNQFQYVPKQCQPNQIYMKLDGDDGLLGSYIFQLINTLFQKNDVWFIYSNLIYSDNSFIGFSRQVADSQFWKQRKLRKTKQMDLWYQKFFYTKVFLQIKKESLLEQNGTYFSQCEDVVNAYYCTQLCGQRVMYVPQVLYRYTIPLIQYKSQQDKLKKIQVAQFRLSEIARIWDIIRSRPQYETLKCLFYENNDPTQGCVKASDYALKFANDRK